jgi:hypothetical protein
MVNVVFLYVKALSWVYEGRSDLHCNILVSILLVGLRRVWPAGWTRFWGVTKYSYSLSKVVPQNTAPIGGEPL